MQKRAQEKAKGFPSGRHQQVNKWQTEGYCGGFHQGNLRRDKDPRDLKLPAFLSVTVIFGNPEHMRREMEREGRQGKEVESRVRGKDGRGVS